jgi:two-component system, cell cycle sensor histidine kinase and response regulator CckA
MSEDFISTKQSPASDESTAEAISAIEQNSNVVSEEQMRQASKIEAIGRLAGGIAHDFNNFLAVIMLHVDMLQLQLPPDSPLLFRVNEIKTVTNNAAGMVRQLLAFSRKQTLQPHPVVLNQIVKEFSKILRSLVGAQIEMQVDLAPDLGVAFVDQNQVTQVLMNLAVNARDALPDGGVIKIETCNIHLEETDATRHKAQPSGAYIQLQFSDNGTGMSEATKAKIFEPFFTTKEAGKGTGLGLATVYGIVKQSDGFIWVDSEPGAGTSFRINFPRVDQTPAAVKPETVVPIPRGSETILIVEDEEQVRRAAVEVLNVLGYQVFEAGNGNQAIQLAEIYTQPIDLLLTDVVMPKMNGKELSQRIKTLHPETVVLFMSGYTDDIIEHHGILEENINFIGKPFSPATLALKVREVLGHNQDEENS